MNITFHKSTGIFHLYNNDISYLMMILPNGQIGQLYFGAAIRDREDFSHLLETCYRTNSAYYSEELNTMCLEHLKQEYPVYGTSDFREPAVEVIQENGSHLSDFQYKGYLSLIHILNTIPFFGWLNRSMMQEVIYSVETQSHPMGVK